MKPTNNNTCIYNAIPAEKRFSTEICRMHPKTLPLVLHGRLNEVHSAFEYTCRWFTGLLFDIMLLSVVKTRVYVRLTFYIIYGNDERQKWVYGCIFS